MKAPASNMLVKLAVPLVLSGTIMLGVKSCSESRSQTTGGQKNTHVALKDLTPEDLKSLGIEGDTPQDTLRTIVGNFRKVQDRLDGLADDNKKLSDENKALKKTHRNVDEQISQVVGKRPCRRGAEAHTAQRAGDRPECAG